MNWILVRRTTRLQHTTLENDTGNATRKMTGVLVCDHLVTREVRMLCSETIRRCGKLTGTIKLMEKLERSF
jgi:hypothetical protein